MPKMLQYSHSKQLIHSAVNAQDVYEQFEEHILASNQKPRTMPHLYPAFS